VESLGTEFGRRAEGDSAQDWSARLNLPNLQEYYGRRHDGRN